MLQIKNVSKKYVTGDLVQTALNDVSMNFRDNEFVAILGPSGSGKTTLLNIIGGLDIYDTGDLIIDGISTKKYPDRDWDAYRNHTIGFVFQSYNLIPHQTVLANVELALTISGISKAERRKKAKAALEKVGLGNQLHKKPNQMSGGQMQRVAIARALVNDPKILLADEPTGALDTETSVQVMDLLKEVASDRLVVMVTHNPELAESYANRIIRVCDGKVTDDSNPFEINEEALAVPEHKNMGHASMSFLTALSLSFNNLWTKKGRTILTAFAGSIGIIGIALIMSLSNGFQMYIDKIQEDTLSSYPLSIMSETADMAATMMAVGGEVSSSQNAEEGTVVEQQMIGQVFAQVGTNDLGSFKAHMDTNMSEISDSINAIKYSYGVTPQIFAWNVSDKLVQVNPATLFADLTGNPMMSAYMDSNVFQEMIDNRGLLEEQYDILQGRWPEEYNEMVMVLSDPNSITDYTTYTLGLRDQAELSEMVAHVMAGNEVETVSDSKVWTYDDLMNLSFRLVHASSLYKFNQDYGVWEDMRDDKEYMDDIVRQGEELVIVGIVCPKEGVSAYAMVPGIAYTHELTERVISVAENSTIVNQQLSDSDINVFTGKRFDDTSSSDAAINFQDMISVDGNMISSAFGMDFDQDSLKDMFTGYMDDLSDSIAKNTAPAQADFTETLSMLLRGMLTDYITENADPSTGEAYLSLSDASAIAEAYLSTDQAKSLISSLENKYVLPEDSFSQVFRPLMSGMITDYVTSNMPTPEIPDISGSDAPIISGSDIGSVFDPEMFSATITADNIDSAVSSYTSSAMVTGTSGAMALRMTEAATQKLILSELGSIGTKLMNSVASSITVDASKIAGAFSFNFSEEELYRLMQTLSSPNTTVTAESNLRSLGFADRAEPTAISIYLIDFEGKEKFLSFIEQYNTDMETAGQDDQVINYTDMTGILMSSVKTIVDSVSYVLIAFVAVSLVVSSIMIGIITYISVLERTKEIGILRAIGASKGNISQVFNAETFIIGLCSGLIGVGVTLLLIPVINAIIHALIGSSDINAQLPVISAVVLILLSMMLTIIGGLIPSKKAATKDPVTALRSE